MQIDQEGSHTSVRATDTDIQRDEASRPAFYLHWKDSVGSEAVGDEGSHIVAAGHSRRRVAAGVDVPAAKQQPRHNFWIVHPRKPEKILEVPRCLYLHRGADIRPDCGPEVLQVLEAEEGRKLPQVDTDNQHEVEAAVAEGRIQMFAEHHRPAKEAGEDICLNRRHLKRSRFYHEEEGQASGETISCCYWWRAAQ